MTVYTIGQAAREAEVNVETFRYYERRGLVPAPPRSQANYRLYPGGTVRRVRFVKRAQELGFTLSEIRELLAIRDSSEATCDDVREQAVEKMRDIDAKIRSLKAMRKALSTLVDRCPGQGSVAACPIIEALEPGEER
jgi:Hg(II)-responsive transcriptional regulator